MGNIDPNKDVEYDYGIVSVKPQDEFFETPMDPITMMRNALGKEEGGSGVKLDKQKYMESVAFWTKHAIVKWFLYKRMYVLHIFLGNEGTNKKKNQN